MAGALKRGLVALVLSLAVGLVPLLALGGCARQPSTAERPAAQTKPRSLQEVAPPTAVLQLKAALDGHRPAVSIQAPADGALLPPGPWELAVQVRDWPLVDAGPLGLGPHLVIQIDDQEPIRTTALNRGASQIGARSVDLKKSDPEGGRVSLRLDPLSPGSHRITVYAARPWGEAVKDPAASDQITVHRVAATPLTLPRRGEPQLRPVSPPLLAASEPVLIDWLLRDAPLQHLRDDDTRWRLRITINGDSFQVDRQSPLWLKGFQPGSNAVVLELLDGLGEPIAPTLNTLVQEVIVRPGERPVWNGPALAPEVLAALLGQAPAPTAPAPGSGTTASAPGLNRAAAPGGSERLTDKPTAPLKGVEAPPAATGAEPAESTGAKTAASAPKGPGPGADASMERAAAAVPSSGPAPASAGIAPTAAVDQQVTEPAATAADGRSQSPAPGPAEDTAPPPPSPIAAKATARPIGTSPAKAPPSEPAPPSESLSGSDTLNGSATAPGAAPVADTPNDSMAQADSATDPGTDPNLQNGAVEGPPQRAAPPSLPPARSELNDDGSVIRPKRQGLLSGLRGGGS